MLMHSFENAFKNEHKSSEIITMKEKLVEFISLLVTFEEKEIERLTKPMKYMTIAIICSISSIVLILMQSYIGKNMERADSLVYAIIVIFSYILIIGAHLADVFNEGNKVSRWYQRPLGAPASMWFGFLLGYFICCVMIENTADFGSWGLLIFILYIFAVIPTIAGNITNRDKYIRYEKAILLFYKHEVIKVYYIYWWQAVFAAPIKYFEKNNINFIKGKVDKEILKNKLQNEEQELEFDRKKIWQKYIVVKGKSEVIIGQNKECWKKWINTAETPENTI